HSEAELMRAAWRGNARELVVDPDARTTVENMANALNDVLRVGAPEVVVVTSSWHAPRAKVALRWLLLHTGVRVRSASPAGRSRRASLREVVLWPLLSVQSSAGGCVAAPAVSALGGGPQELAPVARPGSWALTPPRRGSAASPRGAGRRD